jgi:hypothetical protein
MLLPQKLGAKETEDTIVSLWEEKICWISETKETKGGRAYCWLPKGEMLLLINYHRTWGSWRQSRSNQGTVTANQREHFSLDVAPCALE